MPASRSSLRRFNACLGAIAVSTIALSADAAPPALRALVHSWLPEWASPTLVDAVSQHLAQAVNVETPVDPYANVPPEEALTQAQLALRAARPSDAQKLAERWLEHAPTPSTEERAHALDLHGHAAWLAEDYAAAVGSLSEADKLAPGSPIRAWRLAWLADAHFRLGDYRETIDWGAQSLELAPREFSSFVARAVYYRAHAFGDSPDPRTLAEFLDMHPEYPQRRDAQIELLQSWIAVGNLRQAALVADHLIWEEPWTPQSNFARQIVRNNPELERHTRTLSRDERVLKAREYRGLRQWQAARVELLLLLEELQGQEAEAQASGELGKIHFELARNSMEAGDYAGAHAIFETIDPSKVEGSEPWEVLREYGYNLSRRGIHQEALTILRESAALRGGQAGTDLLGEFLFDLGHYSEYRAMVGSLSSAKRPAPFERAYLDYLAADYETAIRAMDRVASNTTNDHLRHRANYWAARSELHLGQVADARRRFEAIVRTRPHDYYGILAASRLRDLDAMGVRENTEPGAVEWRRLPGRIHWDGDQDSRVADFQIVAAHAETMGAYSQELPKNPPLADIIAPWVELLPELETVLALSQIGAEEDARKVYRALVDEVQKTRLSSAPSGNRPARLNGFLWEHSIDNRPSKRGWWGIPLSTPRYIIPDGDSFRRELVQRQLGIRRGGEALTEALIAIGRAIEDHHVVRRLVQRERGLSGNPPTEGAQRVDWLEAYPRPFPSTVLELTRQYNMNPYLLWALIIVESDMNPDAISRADAYGLMQVIPKTGDRVAWELGETSFGIHDLLDPHVAIRYGAWYMGELIHKFHNQESLGLASYNTGPHRVARWLDWRGSELDYDEFLETIPFPGAHNYHKRILRYAATYQMLYERELKMYIGLDMKSDYDPKINF